MASKRVSKKSKKGMVNAKKAAIKKSVSGKKSQIAQPVAEVKIKRPTIKQLSVTYLTEAPRFKKPKRIHPRRRLPLIPEGEDVQIPSATPQALFVVPHAMAAPGAAPQAATDNIAVVRNTELSSPGQNQTASNVDEPSVACNGNVVLYTGNWYAAVSLDGGATFQFIDPATAFQAQDPPGSSFCCDQVAQYISKIDTFVWLLQYGPDTGDNIQRIAFAKTADVAQGRWRLFDISAKSLGAPGAFLDFPDLAVGENALYVTTNIFPKEFDVDGKAGAAVVRIPFSGIKSGKFTAKRFVTMQSFSLRVAQNCGKTAFFAAHDDTSTLRVFSWKESAVAPTSTTVKVARWVDGNGYQSRTPDNRRWLDRADSRITGATMRDTELWFAWGSNRGGANQRPRAFVQIVRIDSKNMKLIENINLWDPNSAICYAALATNSNKEIGVSYMIGGGNRFPSHVAGILTGTRKDVVIAEGSRSPLIDPRNGHYEWGDYLTIRRNSPNQKLFAATGYTMQGSGDGSNRDVTPRFVLFGRSQDV